MGSRWGITLVGKDTISAEQNIDTVIAEVARIENLISDWKPESQVSQVNSHAGIAPVRVDREVFELTKRALHLSRLTNGAFDISSNGPHLEIRRLHDRHAFTRANQKIGGKGRLQQHHPGQCSFNHIFKTKRDEDWVWCLRRGICRRSMP